jgi:hypothetical protein
LDDVPAEPEPGISVSPGVFDWSTSVIVPTGVRLTTSATSSVVTAFPIARTRVSPAVPVTTTASSAAAPSVSRTVTSATPLVSVKVAVAGW